MYFLEPLNAPVALLAARIVVALIACLYMGAYIYMKRQTNREKDTDIEQKSEKK